MIEKLLKDNPFLFTALNDMDQIEYIGFRGLVNGKGGTIMMSFPYFISEARLREILNNMLSKAISEGSKGLRTLI